jgi:hypothetical protein
MKGHKGFTGILREWPDACLFAVYEVYKTRERGSSVDKVTGGGRIVHTCWSPGWDAKNRLGLSEVLELDYAAFAAEVEANRPDKLRQEFSALLKTAKLDDNARAKWEKTPVDTLSADRIKVGIQKLQSLQ